MSTRLKSSSRRFFSFFVATCTRPEAVLAGQVARELAIRCAQRVARPPHLAAPHQHHRLRLGRAQGRPRDRRDTPQWRDLARPGHHTKDVVQHDRSAAQQLQGRRHSRGNIKFHINSNINSF